MVEIDNPNHVVTYDEVYTFIDPSHQEIKFEKPFTYVTNLNDESSLDASGDTIENLQTRRRRSLLKSSLAAIAEDVFHAHVRTKLAGFPTITISDDLLVGFDSKNEIEVFRRKLASADNDSSSTVVSISSPVTDAGTFCFVEQDIIDVYTNSTVRSFAPCLSDIKQDDMLSPVAYFSGLDLSTQAGLISWPTSSKNSFFDYYYNVEIVPRADLQYYRDLHQFNLTKSNNVTLESNSTIARHLLAHNWFAVTDSLAAIATTSSMQKHSNAVNSERKLRVAVDEQQTNLHPYLMKRTLKQQKLAQQFQNLDASFEKIVQRFEKRKKLLMDVANNDSSSSVVTTTTIATTTVDVDNSNRKLLTSASNTFATNVKNTVTKLATISTNLVDRLVSVSYTISGWNVLDYLELKPDIKNFVAYEVNISNICGSFNINYQKYVNKLIILDSKLAIIYALASTVNVSINVLKTMENDLQNLVTLKTDMSIVMPVIGRIPYIGVLANGFYKIYSNLITSPVQGVKNKLRTINQKIAVNKIKQKVAKLLNRVVDLHNSISRILDFDNFIQVIFLYDSFCPVPYSGPIQPYTKNATFSGEACFVLNQPLVQINNFIDELDSVFNGLIDSLKVFTNIIQQMNSFETDFDFGIIKVIQQIFGVIANFLNKSVSSCIPWLCSKTREQCSSVSYPCGVKMCKKWGIKYPCGVNMCSSNVCVPYPYLYPCSVCATFTIADIVNGVMSVVTLLQDAMTSLMSSLASSLGITFPEFKLPGLPDVNVLSNLELSLDNMFDYVFNDVNFINLFPACDNFFTLDASFIYPKVCKK
jgi:hypothetical protein